jgi:hypothetical protein
MVMDNTPTVSVLVTHERDRWKATEVIIEGRVSEGSVELVRRAREFLRCFCYDEYVFVTEHPLPPLN